MSPTGLSAWISFVGCSVEDSSPGTGYRAGKRPFDWICLRTSLRDGAVFGHHP